MCGRFALISDTETLIDEFGVAPETLTALPPSVPRYNVAPTQPVAAIRLNPNKKRELTFFQWGLIPSWAKDIKMGSRMINARGETVAEKPSFRAAFKRRRCIIPADGFYEWQKLSSRKQPMYIHQANGAPFALAGLWEMWRSPDGDALQTCTIITTTPNELMAPIHNRMPVILEREDFDMWLDPGDCPEQGLHLIRPFPSEKMAAHPVSTFVNRPINDAPQCIQPLN
ncbi:MAG: SOS response-associated peptidase [Chloroflexi bacterium]|nr:MAG: SOS response-associated peptidase [Chloroflexota bacterium]